MKRYNPGLSTAILLLFPWSLFLLIRFEREASHLLAFNLTGIRAGILGHAAIVAYALRQRSNRQDFPKNEVVPPLLE
jgi:hypothetical protein